jgi:hypothetical protein
MMEFLIVFGITLRTIIGSGGKIEDHSILETIRYKKTLNF